MAVILNKSQKLDLSKGLHIDTVFDDSKLTLKVVGEANIIPDKTSVPIMTSNTTPNGIASANASYDNNSQPWRAFDNNINSLWRTDGWGGSHWLAYTFTSPKVIVQYSIRSGAASTLIPPKNWILQGSSDSQVWDDLHSITEATWGISEKKTFRFKNRKAYLSYRILISDVVQGSGVGAYIYEFELFEEQKILQYIDNGHYESDIIDLSRYQVGTTKVQLDLNVSPNTSMVIFTSSSQTIYDFSEWYPIDSNGNATSPRARYIKIKIEFNGIGLEDTIDFNTFYSADSSKYEPNPFVVFNGDLQLKTNFIKTLNNDSTWNESGLLYQLNLNKGTYFKVNKIEVI
ncbi:hypothetical protein [Paenibacillus sp. NPDC058174]|uniref:galactose-binding domain-containing protein n=1 Tax=Paenibacillus sp. NPDC058174 TaxID=3346366 RepID=UPI0036DBB95F